MIYSSLYRVPDEGDQGILDQSAYLLVNSAGYYEYESYFKMSHRKTGRRDFYLGYNYYGPMTVRMGGREHTLQPGSLFLYRPQEEQYYGHASERKFLSYWVHFTGYGAEEILRNANLSDEGPFFAGVHNEIATVFENIMNELRDKKAGFELASASLLSYLLALLSRRIERGSGIKVDKRGEIYESIKYIHDNYTKELYVTELAEFAHLSADRYTTLFKSITDTTPLQYIIKFRLQKACDLMKNTHLNIQQISSLVGFDDQLYFSRMFKKVYGATPSEYMTRFD